MQLPIVLYGHPVLRKKAKEIQGFDEAMRKLIADMKETLLDKKGLGLAAPQINRSVQLFLTNVPATEEEFEQRIGHLRVFINPKILSHSEEEWLYDEGCLSVPKLYLPIPRPVTIVVRAQDETGKEFEETLTGWPARVFCHENDHLNGVLHIDRASRSDRQKIALQLKRMEKEFKDYNKQFGE